METRREAPYMSSGSRRTSQASQSDSPESGGVFPYLHILRNRKGLIAGAVAISLLYAFFLNWRQRPVYRASAELILQSRSKTPSLSQAPVIFFQDATLLATQFRLIKSPHLAGEALKKLEKPENREGLLHLFALRPSKKRNESGVFSEKERQALIGLIQGAVSMQQPDRAVRIITISVEGYEPAMAARLTDAAAEAYIEINYSAHLDSFRQSFGMNSKSLAEIREKIKTGEFASQKINSEIQLLEALTIYGERHPLVIKLRSEISELARKLRLGVKNLQTMEISQRTDKDLVPLLMRPTLVLEELQKIEADLHTVKPILEQEVASNREMYNSIFRRLQEVELQGGGNEWVDAKILERAGVPGQPIRPNKRMNLMMGLFFGLFFGMGLAFFLEYLDSSVRSIEDVKSYLKLFPLGMVPQVDFGEKKEKGEGEIGDVKKVGRDFWLASDSKVPLFVAEAYRIIRTNLAFGSIDSTLKTLQVTSAVKGEGKTTTAANLAMSLASAGSRILLIDGDLRRPALRKILNLEQGAEGGLTDALMNGKTWQSVVVPTATPNLFFIHSGTLSPNPAELLSSKRMKSLIAELKENFDTVIIDSPPVVSVADATIISSLVDGTILVFRSGFVPRHLCLHAKDALESVHAKVIGCVLNGVQTQHQPYHYYDYYRQYGRYHEEEEEEKLGGEGELSPLSPSSETIERLKVLKEPLLVFLSSGWARLTQLLKWEQWNSKEETKSSVGRH